MTDEIIHISFSTTLADLPVRKQNDARAVLAALKTDGRLSVFDATSSRKLALTLGRLARRGLYKTTLLGFPWRKVQITEAGEKLLKGKASK